MIPSVESFSTKKMQSNSNIFNDSIRQQYINYENLKNKKLPSFLRAGASEPEGTFKLAKKNS